MAVESLFPKTWSTDTIFPVLHLQLEEKLTSEVSGRCVAAAVTTGENQLFLDQMPSRTSHWWEEVFKNWSVDMALELFLSHPNTTVIFLKDDSDF